MPTRPLRTNSAPARKRAKQACRQCNARRVRCDVTESQPCSNCRSLGAACELVPSRRGRYPRKPRSQVSDPISHSGTRNVLPASTISPHPRHEHARTPDTSINSSQRDAATDMDHLLTPTSPHTTSLPPGTASSFFFGESNLLTSVPRPAPTSYAPQHNSLSYPGMFNTPRPADHVMECRSERAERYLREEGALTFPSRQSCLPALRAYFTWFHPCFPVVDRANIATRFSTRELSPLLFHAMLFIAATYCDENTISSMGFVDRFHAKSSFYNRARLLFDTDWEKDQLTVLQSLFLMSFWRGRPSNLRDVRYWLGVTITVAQTFGFHRSTRFTTSDSRLAGLRRRIWWSIYVRERQAATSLGLPSRIRDEDCDVEILAPADLECDVDNDVETAFGPCLPEHINYVIKMVEIAQLLGRIIDIHFVPGRMPSSREDVQQLKDRLEQWRLSLPEAMRHSPEPEESSVWACLIHLAYKSVLHRSPRWQSTYMLTHYTSHLRILIHRGCFLQNRDESEKQAAINAASRISRISEDMLAQKTIRFGQMHLITSLFAALCIHVIDIRTSNGVSKRLAESRAQMCLLGLKEIQKYWIINNLVLDLFLQYLDESTAKRLHGEQVDSGERQPNTTLAQNGHCSTGISMSMRNPQVGDPSLQSQPNVLESDLYLNFFSTSWEGVDDSMLDFDLLLDSRQHPLSPVRN